jgi:predicted RNA methylase
MPTEPFITSDRHLTLKDILGYCEEFKRHHGRWPHVTATEADFLAAGMHGLSGSQIERALRTSSNGLDEDPEFRMIRYLAFANGGWDVNIQFIDPEHCKRMPGGRLQRLADSMHVHPAVDRPAAPRPAGHIWVQLPVESKWRTGHSTYAPVSEELIDYIEARGMIYGSDLATIQNEYFLSVIENGRIYLKYNRIIGSRYVGTMSEEQLGQLRARLVEEGEAAREAPAVTSRPGAAAAPAPARLTVEQELALLIVDGAKLQLPKQQLQHYDEISRRMGKAGGRYVTGRRQFVFDDGVDCADLLRRLVAGETVNFRQEYQFFATPEGKAVEAAEQIRSTLGTLRGKRGLEPSAGTGALANVARGMGADMVVIEAWNVNAIKLRAQGYDVIERDFLSVTPEEIGTFDFVLANPPFARNQDIQHVMHMLQFIRPGGALSVIMSTAWLEGKTKAHAQFKEFLATQEVTVTAIEAGAFKESGTVVPTVRLDFRDVNVPRAAEDFHYQVDQEQVEEEEPFALAMQ